MSASLDTVIVRTADVERLGAWYRAVLELGEWERHPGHLGQRVGSIWFGLDAVDRADSGGAVVAWFHVPDLQATYERAAATGAGVLEPPADKPMGYRLARVLDPDGNVVGLAQKRSATS